jgi:hypothetical protein
MSADSLKPPATLGIGMAGPGPMAIKWPRREEMGMAGAWLGSAGIQPALAARGVGPEGEGARAQANHRLREPTRGGARVGVGSGVFGRSTNWALKIIPRHKLDQRNC